MNNTTTSSTIDSSSAVWAVNPDGTLRSISAHHADHEMKAASHIKLILAERLSAMVKAGTIDPTLSVTLQQGMLGNDPGRSSPAAVGMRVPLLEAVDNALRYSSNTDTNLMIHAMYKPLFDEGKKQFPQDATKAEQYAFDAITADLRAHGYPKTRLNNFLNLHEDHQSERWKNQQNTNITTSNDVGVAMQRLWDKDTTIIDKTATKALRDAKEKLDPASLGEKISGTSIVKAHAGRYKFGDTEYISVGFLNGNGGEPLSTFQPFLDEAYKEIEKDQKNLALKPLPVPTQSAIAPTAPAQPEPAPIAQNQTPTPQTPTALPSSLMAELESVTQPLLQFMQPVISFAQPILRHLEPIFHNVMSATRSLFTPNTSQASNTPTPPSVPTQATIPNTEMEIASTPLTPMQTPALKPSDITIAQR
ncbi:MAG: hypothetical protein EAY65_00015 [Alphaproteobacteria bacterium]|nr:MAG: hypothetical protein EAY65_00015 [Alphaproteobacteria bacterium]